MIPKKILILVLLLLLCSQVSYADITNYKKITLEECIKLALKNNYTLKQIEKEIKSSKLDVKVSHYPLYPQIDASTSYLKSKNRIEAENYSTSFSLNQLIYDGDKTASNIKRAKSGLLIAQSEYEQAKINLISQVKIKYYELLYKQKVLEVANESLKKTRVHLDLATARLEAGLVAKSDVLKAEVEAKKAELYLINSENELRKANVELNRILGTDLNEKFSAEEDLSLEPIKNSLEFYLKKALKQREEILQQEIKIQDLKSQLISIEADKKPLFSLRGNYNLSDTEFPPDDKSWDLGVFGSINLYDGKKTRNEVKSLEEDIERFKIAKIDLYEEIKEEVIKVFLDLQKELEAIEVSKKAESYAQENLKLAEGRYETGVGSMIELTDAQVELKQAKLEKIKSTISYLKAKAALTKAIGGL